MGKISKEKLLRVLADFQLSEAPDERMNSREHRAAQIKHSAIEDIIQMVIEMPEEE